MRQRTRIWTWLSWRLSPLGPAGTAAPKPFAYGAPWRPSTCRRTFWYTAAMRWHIGVIPATTSWRARCVRARSSIGDPKQGRLLLAAAEQDFSALRGMTDTAVFADEIFGLHVQQAVEKLFKAWLALLGETYPTPHNLARRREHLHVDALRYRRVPGEPVVQGRGRQPVRKHQDLATMTGRSRPRSESLIHKSSGGDIRRMSQVLVPSDPSHHEAASGQLHPG